MTPPRDVTLAVSEPTLVERIRATADAHDPRNPTAIVLYEAAAQVERLASWRETVQTYVAEQIEADGSDPSQASSAFAAIGLIIKRTERAAALAAERDALREKLAERERQLQTRHGEVGGGWDGN